MVAFEARCQLLLGRLREGRALVGDLELGEDRVGAQRIRDRLETHLGRGTGRGRGKVRGSGRGSLLYLPYISRISPLYLPTEEIELLSRLSEVSVGLVRSDSAMHTWSGDVGEM